MLDGLGLAETTPGPLILVLQFIGFLAAYRAPGGLDPLLAGTLGAVLTVWVTFMPCFAWIFLGAPHAERLRSNRALSAALTAVTAAVVGVIANLALWFALHSLFAEHRPSAIPGVSLEWPVLSSANWPAILLALLALVAALRFKAGILPLLGGSALAGLLLGLAGLA
jgi:chromate transporter